MIVHADLGPGSVERVRDEFPAWQDRRVDRNGEAGYRMRGREHGTRKLV